MNSAGIVIAFFLSVQPHLIRLFCQLTIAKCETIGSHKSVAHFNATHAVMTFCFKRMYTIFPMPRKLNSIKVYQVIRQLLVLLLKYIERFFSLPNISAVSIQQIGIDVSTKQ